MCLTKTIQRIQHLDFLIRVRATGSSRELARQIGVSQRTVFNYLNDFRGMGAPVAWSPSDNSYIYNHTVHFIFGFRSVNPPEQDEPNPFTFSEERSPGRQELCINH